MDAARELFAGGDAYELFMGRWSRRLAPGLVSFASVDASKDVLDLGCGTGALAFALADAIPGAWVTGVDASEAYVRQARAHASSPRLRFVVGDAQSLEFEAATFDAALSLVAFNFIPDPRRALREMVRVTRPAGIVAAAVWDYAEGMTMLRVFWEEAGALDPATEARSERHMPLCREGELASLWRAAGLDGVEERPLAIDMAFDSFEDFWTPFLGGQGPAGALVASFGEGDRHALEARLRARLLGAQPDGAFVLQARAWGVKGAVPARQSKGLDNI